MSCSKIVGNKKCKRSCAGDLSFCWQHLPDAKTSSPKTFNSNPLVKSFSPKQTPKYTPKYIPKYTSKQTPPSSLPTSPRRVSFSTKLRVKHIPPRNPDEPGGIAWAEEITNLQGICVSSVLDVYSTWDRETFNILASKKKYEPQAEKLVESCLRVMENKNISENEKINILRFAQKRENKRSEYIKTRISEYKIL